MAKDLDSEFRLPWGHRAATAVDALWDVRKLLRRLEKGYLHDICLHTTGHLNPNNLYRPPEKIVHHWRNAYPPTARGRPAKPSEKKVAAMKDALAHFTINTALRPSEAPGAPLFRYLHPPAQPPPSEGGGSSRQCALSPAARDEYCYVASHLAGLTKADKYEKFLRFQRNVLATQDLLESDFTGAKAALRLERKLEQVRGSCGHRHRAPRSHAEGDTPSDTSVHPQAERDSRPLQRTSLGCRWCQAGARPGGGGGAGGPEQDSREGGGKTVGRRTEDLSGTAFEDVCSSSLLFGGILKEVKDEYELYMAVLLSAQPTEQYQTLLEEARGLVTSSVKTEDVARAREELRALVAATNAALEHNDRLRGELAEERRRLRCAQEKAESSEKHVSKEEEHLTLTDQVERKRCEVLQKLDEIQALEQEMKTTLVHTGVLQIAESRVKSIETETIKLERANIILKKKIDTAENQVKQFLGRSELSGEEQRNLWEFIKEYVRPKETDND
ncbi:PREDICTED: uncharacterized protein C6orf118 homolog [Myotis davidii]|uniref:uncharacterized protein C6orf118 homolog n=1 Tax=Myotis davidii TaxID=225400 RepID=UPI000767A4B6|nr:PREDICTED: uncharacterized protein C6orf118 homolog [Myotis davidii]